MPPLKPTLRPHHESLDKREMLCEFDFWRFVADKPKYMLPCHLQHGIWCSDYIDQHDWEDTDDEWLEPHWSRAGGFAFWAQYSCFDREQDKGYVDDTRFEPVHDKYDGTPLIPGIPEIKLPYESALPEGIPSTLRGAIPRNRMVKRGRDDLLSMMPSMSEPDVNPGEGAFQRVAKRQVVWDDSVVLSRTQYEVALAGWGMLVFFGLVCAIIAGFQAYRSYRRR